MRRVHLTDKLCSMKRELLALLVTLALLLQGSAAAFAAASPVMSTDCRTIAAARADVSPEQCCPKGQHAMSCCLDLCASSVAMTMSPVPSGLPLVPTTVRAAKPPMFFSRSDSPLIRPPIL